MTMRRSLLVPPRFTWIRCRAITVVQLFCLLLMVWSTNAEPDATVPKLTIVSGQKQKGTPGKWVPQPLVVSLVDAEGNPVTYAPVDFTTNDGQIQISSLSLPANTLVGYTDVQGSAQVFFRPAEWKRFYQVSASTHDVSQPKRVTFLINSDEGIRLSQSPFDLTVQSTVNPDASSSLTWTHHLSGVTGFRVFRSDNRGDTWKDLATLPATSAGYTVAASQQGIMGHSLFRVRALTGANNAADSVVPVATPAPGHSTR